jgi:hypothetical protein
MNVWTEEQDTLLEQLCASGEKLSTPVIAKIITDRFAIVPPLSRAAIVGRARRRDIKLPLPRNGDGPKIEDDEELKSQHSAVVTRILVASQQRQPYRHYWLPEPALSPGLFLLNAGDGDCRWPINDPGLGRMIELRVCGQPTKAGNSYCPACIAADSVRRRNYVPEGEPKPGAFRFGNRTKKRGSK